MLLSIIGQKEVASARPRRNQDVCDNVSLSCKKKKKGKNLSVKPFTRSYDEVTEVTPKPVGMEAQGPPFNHRHWGARSDAENELSGARDRPVHHQRCRVHFAGEQNVSSNRECQSAGKHPRQKCKAPSCTMPRVEQGYAKCR
jgi:hypothetical protein